MEAHRFLAAACFSLASFPDAYDGVTGNIRTHAALKTRFWGIGWPSVVGMFAAAAQITSSLILTDVGNGNGASIDGMELRRTGLYWWKYGAEGGRGRPL